MNFSLPYSKDKRYLTGIDWVINALDALTWDHAGHGNSSQSVLALEGCPDVDALRRSLRELLDEYRALTGDVRRDGNLCPYWKDGNRFRFNGEPPLTIESIENASFKEILGIFAKRVNIPFYCPTDHIRLHLLRAGDKSYLGLHFDHRLLDAFGAESLLYLLDRKAAGKDANIRARVHLTEPAHLDHWPRRFMGGRSINRLQIRLTKSGLAFLPISGKHKPLKTDFRTNFFSAEETAGIEENAFRESGPFILLPTLLARTIRAFHPLFVQRGRISGNYIIPVPILLRDSKTPWEQLFFNHMSFLFFVVPAEAGERPPAEISAMLRDQLYEQMKDGLPEDICHASMLTRIAPLGLMKMFAKIPLEGRGGSFYFACLRQTGYPGDNFLGAPVENIFHTPHVPPPPGVGVFCGFFRNRLNLALSATEGIISDRELDELIERMRGSMLE